MCCKAIVINIPFEKLIEMSDVKNYIDNGKLPGAVYDSLFIYLNWTPISKDRALEINPRLEEWFEKLGDKGAFNCYTCRQLNEYNLCDVHDTRPHVCSGFPWYNHEPDPREMLYSLDCGYKIDQTKIIKLG